MGYSPWGTESLMAQLWARLCGCHCARLSGENVLGRAGEGVGSGGTTRVGLEKPSSIWGTPETGTHKGGWSLASQS